MTEKQAVTYQLMREIGYEYSLTEYDGAVIMIRYERGNEYTRKLAEIAVYPNGTYLEIGQQSETKPE